MDPAIIEATRVAVEAVVSKPKCTEKLLSKPPFRFLHDLIMAIIKQTGFAQTLYSEAEQNSENVAVSVFCFRFCDNISEQRRQDRVPSEDHRFRQSEYGVNHRL